MAELRTFIFTDIVRSVALKSEMEGRDSTERDRKFIETILTPHRERIEADLAERGGRVVSTAGDGHFLVFGDTTQAALWAVDAQRRHADDAIMTSSGSRVQVRVSLHVGVPQIDPRDPNNFVGKPVDYAARLNDFARGDQILCSRAVAAILEDVQLSEIRLHPHGKRMLRGIGRVEVYELVYRPAGPVETLYEPVQPDSRQWTIIPARSDAPSGTLAPAAIPGTGSTAPQAISLTRPHQLGNYELERLLGSGGMGDVYKARHVLFDRVRAIKVIKPSLIEAGRTDVIRRFYQEIKAVGKLEHKNIVVAVESSSPQDPIHYLVMEYIRGVSLDELVTRHGPLRVEDACEAVRQAARGLQYIAKHGMVHRDIKPSNLMLTTADAYRVKESSFEESLQEVPLIKILDLGLALLIDKVQGRLTHFNQKAMGTGMYMAPEQWKSSTVDIRADIYSLGCSLYHLLAGQPPFVESDLKPEKAHERSKVPPITGPTPVPRKLWDVIRRMMAKDPAKRFQSPEDVVLALAPFCDGHRLVELARKYSLESEVGTVSHGTVTTAPPDIETRPSDGAVKSDWHVRRHPYWWTAGIFAAVLLVAAFAVWSLRDRNVVGSPRLGAAADLVVTLPGMNGLWWFDETPWLTPAQRARLVASLQTDELAEIQNLVRGPDVQVLYAYIAELAERPAGAQPQLLGELIGEDHTFADRARDYLRDYDPLQRSAEQLAPLRAQLERAPPEKRAPTASHLLGVLHLHLQNFDEAEAMLQRAVDQYQRIARDGNRPVAVLAQSLLSLAQSDLGNLSLARSAFSDAREHFTAAAEQVGQLATPHSVYVHGMLTQAGVSDPQSEPDELKAYLDAAVEAIDALQLAEAHPLRAFVHERHAHYALETWRLPEAIQHAHLAASTRDVFANMESVSRDLRVRQGSHHAQQGWFRARQIEALAVHFQGRVPLTPTQPDATLAWETFRELLATLQGAERFLLSDDERIVWEQLRPNFFGRTADCEIFTMGDFDAAANTMAKGIGAAENLNWPTDEEKGPFLVFMHYKQAIALALGGDDRQARQVLDHAVDLAWQLHDNRSRIERFGAFKAVAEALLLPLPEQYAELDVILSRESQEIAKRVRDRDNRQLMLFIAAYLHELRQQDPGLGAPGDEEELDRAIETLLAPLRQRQSWAGNAYMDLVEESAAEAARIRTREPVQEN